MNPIFWRDKKVFLTGHTGFKGAWLSLWLQQLGVELVGFALAPPTTPNLFTETQAEKNMVHLTGDIRDFELVQKTMREYQPDLVIHMAAQPLVHYSYQYPVETYATNVMGTVHVLEAARHCSSVKAILNVTSDKCYENKEWPWAYRENEPFGGHDPYSNSKGCAELVTSAYRNSYHLPLASGRAGNVIGGGDWAKDRLIPDMMRACLKHETLTIRSPHAIRPWQHVLEPLSGYLILAEALFKEPKKFAEGWNFGPHDEDAKPVEWIVKTLLKQWREGITWQLDPNPMLHEAMHLKLDCSKARAALGWHPRWPLKTALEKTVEWYKAFQRKENMREVTLTQIASYSESV